MQVDAAATLASSPASLIFFIGEAGDEATAM